MNNTKDEAATPKRRGRKRIAEKQMDAESSANEKERDNKSSTTNKDDEREVAKSSKKDEEDEDITGNRYVLHIYIHMEVNNNNTYAITDFV